MAAVALNALLTAGFFYAVQRGYVLGGLWRSEETRGPERVERVEFVATAPNDPSKPPSEGRSGGDGRPVTAEPYGPAPRLVAPSSIPDGIPAPSPSTTEQGSGSGPVIGEGGATVGIRPNLGDPRVWARPGIAAVPRTTKERADSVIADLFTAVRDSIARAQAIAAGQRAPGDWTVKGPGGTWGMDQRNIHLGKVKIPNAVLALLSEQFQKNLRGNPTEMEYSRRLAALRADVELHAQREMNEDSFRDAVKQLRARKDRERRARLEEQQQRRQGATVASDGSGIPAGATPPGAPPPGTPAGAEPPR